MNREVSTLSLGNYGLLRHIEAGNRIRWDGATSHAPLRPYISLDRFGYIAGLTDQGKAELAKLPPTAPMSSLDNRLDNSTHRRCSCPFCRGGVEDEA